MQPFSDGDRNSSSCAPTATSGVTTSEVTNTTRYFAQRGECREARLDTFIYRSPDADTRVGSVRRGETVTLAEDRPDRRGWIAVSQPTIGFVEERILERCGVTPSLPNQVRPGVAQLCVNERAGRNGLQIYESPSFNARPLERAFQNERLLVNTDDIRREPSGEVWFRISFPVNGWIPYGFPNVGVVNLENCELLRLRS